MMSNKTAQQLDSCGYELKEQLGKGGSGSVYLARQKSTGQNAAVKMLRLDEMDEQERILRIKCFERETRLCANLNHPNIVKLLDKGKSKDKYLYAVFEYIEGETLRDLIIRKNGLPVLNAWELMTQVLDGLACAHKQGIVHRDLKPSNIMITTAGTRQYTKILDFGISTLEPGVRKPDYLSITLSQNTMGTPSYSAPEQLRGEPPTVKSDLYTWGLVFLECLTGQAVMKGTTLAEIIHRQLSPDEVPLPPPIIGHPLGDLMRRVLMKNHKNRTGQTDRLYSDFKKLNLVNLAGKLSKTRAGGKIGSNDNIERTQIISPWSALQVERRQITVLCCSLGLMPVDEGKKPDFEAIDAFQSDLLGLCKDIGAKYGGYEAGSMGDSIMFFFGYPQAGDSDSRLAARTALEISGRLSRRSAFLVEQQGVRPGFRIGIHSGIVTICGGAAPSGITPNTALKLQNLAPAGTILVSSQTHRLLERYIEFEPFKFCSCECVDWEQSFLLIGERQAEAFSFLQAGPVSIPTVGRDTQINTLQDFWKDAAKGQGHTVLLMGEPGIGKSRLAYKMNRFITGQGHGSIVLRCLPRYRNSGLFPVLEFLKQHFHMSEASCPCETEGRLESILKKCSCKLEWSMPILCSWLSIPVPEKFPPVSHSPERQKMILIEVLEELILKRVCDPPLMIIAEDLHWADNVSLAFFDRLMTGIRETGVMMLMTARPEFCIPWENQRFSRINLAGFSPAEAGLMIRKLVEDKPVHQAVLDTVYDRTDGVPLFIEELVRLMLNRQDIVEQNGVYYIHDGFDAASIPITLQDLLNEKLGGLGFSRETAQTAAVIGRELDYSLLVRVSLNSEASVQNDLDQMMSAGLIYRRRHLHGESFIFRHALIRDAAYNSIIQSVRSEIHGRIAVALENQLPEQTNTDTAGLASHFAEAGRFEKAVTYGTCAAKTALERSLNDEAIFHANKVLDWIGETGPEKEPEARLIVNNILTLAMMGKYGWADSQVRAVAEMSRELLSGMDNNEHTIPVLWSLALYHYVAGNRQEVRELTDELETISQMSGDKGLIVASATFMGLRYMADGNYIESAGLLEKAIKLYDPDLHRNHGILFGLDTRVWAGATLANAYWFFGYNTFAAECGDNAITWARNLNHIPSLGIALLYRGLVHYYTGDKTSAAQVAGELLDYAAKYGLPAYEGYATVLHCWTAGNAEPAESILNTLQAMGCRLALPIYRSMLAAIEAGNGNWDAAINQIDKCLALTTELDEHINEPVLYKARAIYLMNTSRDRNREIRQSLSKAIERAGIQGMLRTEAEALFEMLRLFGPDKAYENRLAQIRNMRPEINETLNGWCGCNKV